MKRCTAGLLLVGCSVTPPSDVVTLDGATITPGDIVSTGQIELIHVHATAGGADLAGIAIALGTNVAGTTPAPAAPVTDASGVVDATLVVPFGVQLVVTATTAPGAHWSAVVDVPLPAVAIDPAILLGTITVGTASEDVYQVDATVKSADGHPVPGVPVAFSQVGVTSNSNPFSPATATTGSDGRTHSFAFVPHSAAIDIAVTAAGAATLRAVP